MTRNEIIDDIKSYARETETNLTNLVLESREGIEFLLNYFEYKTKEMEKANPIKFNINGKGKNINRIS